jgi:hypothetical protein
MTKLKFKAKKTKKYPTITFHKDNKSGNDKSAVKPLKKKASPTSILFVDEIEGVLHEHIINCEATAPPEEILRAVDMACFEGDEEALNESGPLRLVSDTTIDGNRVIEACFGDRNHQAWIAIGPTAKRAITKASDMDFEASVKTALKPTEVKMNPGSEKGPKGEQNKETVAQKPIITVEPGEKDKVEKKAAGEWGPGSGAISGSLADRLNQAKAFPERISRGKFELCKFTDEVDPSTQCYENDGPCVGFEGCELYLDDHPEGSDRGGYVVFCELNGETAHFDEGMGDWVD